MYGHISTLFSVFGILHTNGKQTRRTANRELDLFNYEYDYRPNWTNKVLLPIDLSRPGGLLPYFRPCDDTLENSAYKISK